MTPRKKQFTPHIRIQECPPFILWYDQPQQRHLLQVDEVSYLSLPPERLEALRRVLGMTGQVVEFKR